MSTAWADDGCACYSHLYLGCVEAKNSSQTAYGEMPVSVVKKALLASKVLWIT